MKTPKWAKVAVMAMLPVAGLSGSAAEQLPAEDQLAGKVNLPGEPKEKAIAAPAISQEELLNQLRKVCELQERARFNLDVAKIKLAQKRYSEGSKYQDSARQILKEIPPAPEPQPKTQAILDDLRRLELQNLEAWAGELEQEAKEIGDADGYRQAREKLRTMLAIKDSGISVEKRAQLEVKVKELDVAYAKLRDQEVIRFTSEPGYDVDREIANLHREAQDLYEKRRYLEVRDKIEQILAKRPDDEQAKALFAKINDLRKPRKKPQASPTP
jgi:hypothetical protein